MTVCAEVFSGYTRAMLDALPYRKPILALFGVIILLLLLQAMFPRQAKPFDITATAEEDCEGEALSVPYEYTGGVVEPWSCQVQCQDQKLRYLVYTNGVATQCEPLPGCNDWGEDRGVTCKIPGGAEVPMTGGVPSMMTSQQSS